MKINCKLYFILGFILIFGIILYSVYLRSGKLNISTEEKIDIANKDILNNTWFKIGTYPVNGWLMSHFIFYAIMGYLYPNYKCMIIMYGFGILWEICEWIFGVLLKERGIQKDNNDKVYVTYWVPNYMDLVANLLGLVFGYFIKKK